MEDVRRLPVGEDNEEITFALDDLAREGARRMIAAALRAEADECVERFSDEVDEDGRRRVDRNGRARERRVTVGSGTLAVRAPRVSDKRVDEETGERERFSSRILPAYARRSPKVGEVIPILYLHGLSTGDFRPALEGLLGADAAGHAREHAIERRGDLRGIGELRRDHSRCRRHLSPRHASWRYIPARSPRPAAGVQGRTRRWRAGGREQSVKETWARTCCVSGQVDRRARACPGACRQARSRRAEDAPVDAHSSRRAWPRDAFGPLGEGLSYRTREVEIREC